TSVIQVTATDADDATYGNSARVVYSILEGQPYFSVDAETGSLVADPVISTLGERRRARTERQADKKRQWRKRNRDCKEAPKGGRVSGSDIIVVCQSDASSSPPDAKYLLASGKPSRSASPFQRMSLYEFRVAESNELGSAVGVIRAVDADIGQNAEMDYRIISSDGPGMFDITVNRSTQEGVILLRKVCSRFHGV
ncbi:hypothetical protein XENOCAPTIV_006327, partial [Xenoophorus captivus]